ncbi:MAG: DUF3298 and DUF4163 domain-containing protein [Acidobacteria bacterium]|nr:DUF3298 and DUF4163 domain-containing protein [Acidobacteriota bacterium]
MRVLASARSHGRPWSSRPATGGGRPAGLAMAVLLAACSGPAAPPEAPAPAVPELRWHERNVERSEGDCDTSGGRCCTVNYRFPEIDEAPGEALRRELEGTIDAMILGGDDGERMGETPEAAADAFVEAFRDVLQEAPQVPGGWADERVVEIVHLDPTWVSLRFSHYEFTGGAHPNTFVQLRTLRLSDGVAPSLDDLLVPGGRSRLDGVAEGRFREVRGLSADEDLEAAGFTFFEGDRFALNDNFAVVDDGLLFHYNPYEIAPYVMGPTELFLSWQDLAGIVRPDVHPDVGVDAS